MNVQYAVLGDDLYVIEANPRASRTVPFVSKATGIPLAKIACRVMLGERLADARPARRPAAATTSSVKEAVLPFDRFAGSDALLGPGDALDRRGHGRRRATSRPRSRRRRRRPGARAAAQRHGVPHRHRLRQGRRRSGIAAQLHDLGFAIVATRGTAAAIARMGIPVEPLNKIGEGSPHVVDWIERGDVDLVINTPTGTARAHRRLRDPRARRSRAGSRASRRSPAAWRRRGRSPPARHGRAGGASRCRSSTRGRRRRGGA